MTTKPIDEAVIVPTEDGDIVIESNGSKWNGEAPDSLEVLGEVLKKHKLDVQRFAAYGFIFIDEDGNADLFGNFLDISHVFNIRGPQSKLRGLMEAIHENINRQFAATGEK